MKNLFTIILLITFSLSNAQNFNHPGKLTKSNKTISGSFSSKVNSRTKSLNFKPSNSEEIIDVLEFTDIVFSYDANKKKYSTKTINSKNKIVEIIVLGKASLYKDVISSNFLVETSNYGLKELIRFKSENKTRSNAIGILSIIFGDCPEVRSLVSNNTFTYASINNFVNAYNDCSNLSNDYQFSEKQLNDLEFSKKKGIFNVEIGAAYISQSIEFAIPDGPSFDEDLNIFSIFANASFSPSYFKNFRNKLFFDVGAAVNFNNNASNNLLDIEKNSVQIFVSPRYNFLSGRNINPFLRFNFGLTLDSIDLTTTDTNLISELNGSIDDFDANLIFSIEAGINIYNNFRLSIFFNPEYDSTIQTSENRLRIENETFGIKASYIIGKK